MSRLMLHGTLGLVALATVAPASTPQAWAQLDRRVARACIAAAGLLRARIVEDKASFADTVPIELRLVEGYNRQSVMHVKLCAFHRRTMRVAITDGAGRLGVNRR